MRYNNSHIHPHSQLCMEMCGHLHTQPTSLPLGCVSKVPTEKVTEQIWNFGGKKNLCQYSKDLHTAAVRA